MTTKKKFVVWMYPLPPPSSISFIDSLQSDEVLICPYSRTACQGRGISMNLLKLTGFKPIVDEYLQNMAVTTRDNGKRRISYERQEHSRPYGMHSWMLLAVLLNLILLFTLIWTIVRKSLCKK